MDARHAPAGMAIYDGRESDYTPAPRRPYPRSQPRGRPVRRADSRVPEFALTKMLAVVSQRNSDSWNASRLSHQTLLWRRHLADGFLVVHPISKTAGETPAPLRIGSGLSAR